MWAYDFEVYPSWWCVCFINVASGDRKVFTSDDSFIKLLEFINDVKIFVGFNNYYYDDVILYALVHERYLPTKLYEISTMLIQGNVKITFKSKANELMSLDCIQELMLGVSLKEIEGNLGMNIVECSVPFDKECLTETEKQEIIKYCFHDVYATTKLFKIRTDYFMAKFQIVKEFNLSKLDVKKTRANLVALVLKAKRVHGRDKERLNVTFVDKIKWENIPTEIYNFYNQMIVDFKNGIDFKTIEKRSLAIDIVNTPHKYGLGGLHGALSGYINEQTPMLIADVNSYYPSMMIVYDFLSRNCENKKDFKNLYDERFRLKKLLDTKEYIFKILLNSAYGASKSYYNSLYDPLQANNICINGQIMLTDLIIRLKNYTKLIQSNTDGILFDYKEIDTITKILNEWENNYNLKLGIDKVKAIYQRDVNNYIIVKADGKVKCKGMFKNYKGNDFQRNSLSVIPIALKNYYVDKIPIEKTVNDLLDNNNLLPFQLIAKKSSKYDALAYHDLYSDEMVVLEHKVYRVFAGINQNIGKLYKMADGSFDKYANSPNHIYINNNEIDKIDKNLIDKSFYINLCKSYLIENMNRKVKITNKKTGDIEWLI